MEIKNYIPGWQNWLTPEGKTTLERGYLLPDETQNCMFKRLALAAAKYLPENRQQEVAANVFYDILSLGYLSLATPIAANMGTNRGLPVSCFAQSPGNSINEIFKNAHESAMLSKSGGGLGVDLSNLKGATNVTQWGKLFDMVGATVSQGGGVRKGSIALYLDIEHPDTEAFLNSKEANSGDHRQKIDCNVGVKLSDEFMESLKAGNQVNIKLFARVLELRLKTGSPYLFFSDNVTRQDPGAYAKLGLKTTTSNLCSEIFSHTDEEHTFVCVLSSLNMYLLDEWFLASWRWCGKYRDLTFFATLFLDCVAEEFIQKTSGKVGLEKARRFCKKARSLGLGVIGYHTYLQKRQWSFDSDEARIFNKYIFEYLKKSNDENQKEFVKILGASPWGVHTNQRNTQVFAIAPTTSNSVIGGGVSPGIEPVESNYHVFSGSRGSFVRKNKELAKILPNFYPESEIADIWVSIGENYGSVQHLDKLPPKLKEVFKTAREIDQMGIIRLASDRQKFLCHGQSLNLFLDPDISVNEMWKLHYQAWKLGLKSLYYVFSSSKALSKTPEVPQKAKIRVYGRPDCVWCERAKEVLERTGNHKYEYIVKSEGKVPQIFFGGDLIGGCVELYDFLGEFKYWETPLAPKDNGIVDGEGCSGCEG